MIVVAFDGDSPPSVDTPARAATVETAEVRGETWGTVTAIVTNETEQPESLAPVTKKIPLPRPGKLSDANLAGMQLSDAIDSTRATPIQVSPAAITALPDTKAGPSLTGDSAAEIAAAQKSPEALQAGSRASASEIAAADVSPADTASSSTAASIKSNAAAKSAPAAKEAAPDPKSAAATAVMTPPAASETAAPKSANKTEPEIKLGFGPGRSGSKKAGRAKKSSGAGTSKLQPRSNGSARKRSQLPPIRVTIKSGDSLYAILKSRGLPSTVLPALLSVGKNGDRLKKIRPGQALDFFIDKKGELQRLEYRPDELTTVSYRRKGQGFASKITATEFDVKQRSVSGAIENSLFLDGQRAGLSDRTIMQMAEIFGWDVDFALDLRDGDRFTVIYEELHKDGAKVRDGNILAAEFVNRGRVFRAVRFVHKNGETRYYTPKGRSMRKAFLRTPVRFARISSRFNLRRKHPILHKVRAHRGVDYAAPSGTAIRATGDGRIEFQGRNKGYGKTIIIRHTGGKYSTLYAHMKGYARGMRKGKSVRQGQVIGYVGKTGLATGPHLHYEFRVRGVHKDPLRVKLPKSLPIASKHKAAFQRQARKLIARLNSDGATVAQNN